MTKEKTRLNQSKGNLNRKNFLSILFLLVGTVVLCLVLALMQNNSAEQKQTKSSNMILTEVETTLRDNDAILRSVVNEYNQLNQTTLFTLSQYVNYKDYLSSVREASNVSEAAARAEIIKTAGDLKKLCTDVNMNDVFVIDESGSIILSSNVEYLQKNFSNILTIEQLARLVSYEQRGGQTVVNGTFANDSYSPVILQYEDSNIYIYSTLFDSENGKNYFLLAYFPDNLIENELSSIKSIESVLSGITVGKTGFLFTVDSHEKNFSYFNDGKNDLSGLPYEDHGLQEVAAVGDYVGYQTIDGTKYFCVTREFNSATYGEFTVVAAVVSQEEVVSKNIISIVFSCLAFVFVAAVIVSYGFILRREVANHLLNVEDHCTVKLKEETAGGLNKFTDEEIEERTKILLNEEIEKNKDKILKRKNIGVRNSQGKQRYFSIYLFGKLSAVISIGLIVIFFMSFLSQTLLGLNDATSVSVEQLDEITELIDRNENNTNTIQTYVDDQFLSKAKLISYLLEETPEIMFQNVEEEDIHRVATKDDEGNNVYLTYREYPSVQRYAISNSSALQQFCDNNGIKFLHVFFDDGRVMATNMDDWYFTLSKDPLDQSYPFNDILDDKVDSYVQENQTDELSGIVGKYIGTKFNYYTYLKDGEVAFASRSDYLAYKNGEWTEGNITPHRSLIRIVADESTVDGLFGTTSIDYVLSNMHIYGSDSYFIAFDNTDEHRIIYAPFENMIGKTAESIGMSASAFTLNSSYNGFQNLNGIKYYNSMELLGNYYIATAIPTSNIYDSRLSISLYTLLLSTIFIILASSLFTVSSDKADEDFSRVIKYKPRNEEEESFVITTPSGKKKKTKSVSSRFTNVLWHKKTSEEKLSTILMVYLVMVSLVIVGLLLYSLTNSNQSTIFSYIFSDIWERGFNVFALTKSLMIIIIVFTITKLLETLLSYACSVLGARAETTGNLVISVLKYGGLLGTLFYCLYLFGFDTTSLLASAGILSIVIGLGAQSLISDILAGIFIVFEGSFRVGDIVTIGDFRGQVLEIGLRTTKIEDISKNIKIFNNSAISGVLNMTKEASYAAIDVSIEYGESLERVEKILKDSFPGIRRKLPEIIEGPYYKGVQELGDSAVVIKIIAQCEEKDRIQLSRDLNREIFLLFKRNNVNIPFPQVTLSHLEESDTDVKLSKSITNEVDRFLRDQKDSQDVE